MLVHTVLLVVFCIVASDVSEGLVPEPGIGWPPPANSSIPLYHDMGNMTFELAKNCPAHVQHLFNQGFRFIAAFDIVRAVMSFRAAQEAAGGGRACPLCVWGEALALGPNLNAFDEPRVLRSVSLAFSKAAEALAHQQRALSTSSCVATGKDPLAVRDHALTEALTLRYAPTAADYVGRELENRRLYASAMAKVAEMYPQDANVLTLAAEAWMNMHPWDYWLTPKKPRAETSKAIDLLETVLKNQRPHHGFAVHLYVHVTEASEFAALAVPYARMLPDLFPGSPHTIHMAFHTLMHTGGYRFSERMNVEATEMSRQVYPMHNLDTLAWICRVEGRSKCALKASLKLEQLGHAWLATPNLFETGFPVSRYAVQNLLTLVAFGRDVELLDKEAPPTDADDYWWAIWHFTQGVAAARMGLSGKARIELADFLSLQEHVKHDISHKIPVHGMPSWAFGNFGGSAKWGALPISDILELASYELQAQCAVAASNTSGAIFWWRQALKKEAVLPYDEPPAWYLPVAGRLGAALMAVGFVGEAEQVYKEALKKYPHDGWLLFGLLQACSGRTSNKEACASQEAQFLHAWRRADVTLVNSGSVEDSMISLSSEQLASLPHRFHLLPVPLALLAFSAVSVLTLASLAVCVAGRALSIECGHNMEYQNLSNDESGP